jgi:Lipocalin-like domain
VREPFVKRKSNSTGREEAGIMPDTTTQTGDKLVGTWKLIGASGTTSTGERIENPYGVDPVGFLTYTAEGRISSVISYGGRKPLPISGGKMEDQAEAFKTFLAYAGCYTWNGDKVAHHIEVSSIQNYVGRDLIRTIKFDDDRLTLITPPTLVNGKVQSLELVWQRASAEF